ncbi:MAG: adenylate/guanylate cyclase domain-containing protein [Anaerolineae bacterium]
MTKILVIDDEEGIRLGVAEYLRFENYEVFDAPNGKKGLELAREHLPDLIVCDIMMPELDGYGVLEGLRQNHETQNIPFVFLTAKADRDSHRKGMGDGADDYVTKPFTFTELLATIRARLERRQTLLGDAARQIDELHLLRRIDQELTVRLNPDWIIEMMMDWALRRTGAEIALMGIIDQDEPFVDLRYVAGQWPDKKPKQGDRWPLEGIIGTTVRSESPVHINNIDEMPRIRPTNPEMRSLLGVPLATSERRLGVMLLESKRLAAFKDEDVDFLLQIANRAAMALEQSYLFQMLLQQHQQERELRETFGRFVSKDVAEAIRTGEVDVVGKKVVVSVVFCDIRGFTSLTERLEPHAVLEILNEFLPLVVDAAHQHGGMVNKFGGDSTLLVFGAPQPQQESAFHALKAALQIHNRLENLNNTKFKERDFKLKVGIGVNTGEVIAGVIGPKERQEYTVIGDTVNLSSRIQALNKEYPQYAVLAGDDTYHALGSRSAEFTFADLGDVAIRGKIKSVKVWGVMETSKPQ